MRWAERPARRLVLQVLGPAVRRGAADVRSVLVREPVPAQFLGTELTLGDAEDVTGVAVVGLAAVERTFQGDVLADGFVTPVEVGRERFHRAVEPEAVEAKQRSSFTEPPLLRTERFPESPPGVAAIAGSERGFAETAGAGMHVKRCPTRRGVGHGLLDAGREERAVSVAPDFPIAQKGVALHELHEVGLDVGADHAVGFDDGARLGIDVVPRTAELGAKPAAQRSQQVGEGFAAIVRPAHAFVLRQEIGVEVRPASVLAGAGIPTGPFDDDLVHVRAHEVKGSGSREANRSGTSLASGSG